MKVFEILSEILYFIANRIVHIRNYSSHHVTDFFYELLPSSSTFGFLIQKITAFRFLSHKKKSDFFHKDYENPIFRKKNEMIETYLSK